MAPSDAAAPAPLKAAATVRNLIASADAERKRRLVRRVPILRQVVAEQHCTEEQLVLALRVAAFADGEYIYCQGQSERDVFFIDEGHVLITQRRLPSTTSGSAVPDAALEVPIETLHEAAHFGELCLLQRKPTRRFNAVARGAVACLVLGERDFDALLAPVHALLLYRFLLRAHGVLEKDRLFHDWAPAQRQHVIDRCQLQAFAAGDAICRQGETGDDRYFLVAEGEADVVLDEADADAATATATVVARKSRFQGFGEMGLLARPRTASVVAVGPRVVCVVVTRRDFRAAAQLLGGAAVLDADAEALLATTLLEEWKLVLNARHLHLSNPRVAHYLVTFIRQFKAAYHHKFAGKTLYLDLFRRLHAEPALADEFAFVAARIAWDAPASSLGILRSETRRVLSKPSPQRSADETSFVARLIEPTAFLAKFDVPGPRGVDRHTLARCLAKVVAFATVAKDAFVFRQGQIESRAFLILRGKIHIVNEDATTNHHDVLATLSAGDSFGELSLVTRLQRSATTVAACDTDLLVFDRDHLAHVQAALPGVSVQQLMVQRAEFLARLSFLRGRDFGQCIRVAHDLHEVAYDARHVFLREPPHARTLYIVKSGELAVFIRTRVAARSVLARVATIGAQEFFGVAIATPTTGSTPSPLPQAVAVATSAPPSATTDLGAAVYVSTTRVVMLELSEHGWRRLGAPSLLVIRNVLLERHEWNENVARRQQQQQQQQGVGVATFFHVDRPWQQVAVPVVGPASGGDRSAWASAASEPLARPTSQLARHVYHKRVRASPFAALFPDKSATKASETRQTTTTTTTSSSSSSSSSTTHEAWGWNSPLAGGAALSRVHSTAGAAAPSLRPLVSFAGPTSPPSGARLASTPPLAALLPSPPRGDRQALLSIAHLSPRSAAVAVAVAASCSSSSTASPSSSSSALWKARAPAARRSEYHAP